MTTVELHDSETRTFGTTYCLRGETMLRADTVSASPRVCERNLGRRSRSLVVSAYLQYDSVKKQPAASQAVYLFIANHLWLCGLQGVFGGGFIGL